MKALAMLVTYLGYAVMVYGLDHITGHCTPFGCTVLGEYAGKKCPPGSVPCSGVKAKAKTTSGNTIVPGTSLPSGGSGLPAVKGKYTSPALPGFQVYHPNAATFTTGTPPAGYTVVG